MRVPLRPDLTAACQAASIGVGVLSAVLVARGSFLVTPEMIARLGSTYFGYNKELVYALAGQAGEARAGLLLLVLSVVFQLPTLGEHVPTTASRRWAGLLAGVLLAGIVGGLAFCWADHTSSVLARKALEILSKSAG